ncbi:ABC transporter permease [Sphingobacterium lactis]|uniref:Iron complex transport system permease protein n=1 Tax=Sphingobacterium lactis TaxID=797291 RepID=A0A1H5YXN0_9SPHI|nr:iron chelate uptake ABC transporter family permease subunit [Sphingobacterium lactis]SEG28798.1 iron complex transport system permease protein [Sphingobacterium lactis]
MVFTCIKKQQISSQLLHYWLPILGVLLVSLSSITIGVEDFKFSSMLNHSPKELETLLVSRVPRTITLLLTGAGLSICGVIIQQITQNKFISPTTAGTLDAAKLGILFALIVFPQHSFLAKLCLATLCCLGLTCLFTFSIAKITKHSTVIIPVLGVMYGYVLNGIANVIGFQFNIIQNMESWMVGNFAKSIKGQYETIYLMVPLLFLCYRFAQKFTIAGLGKDFTSNLGLNFTSIVTLGLLLTSIMVSCTILTVGSLPFLDLIIPNLVSVFYGDNIHRNLPYIACYGSIALVLCDIIGRTIIFPYEIPSSMIVGSLGALAFLVLLTLKNR